MEKNTEKTDVLRRIVSLLLILTLITSAFVNLPLSVSAADEGLQGGQSNIVNGSFEDPSNYRIADLAKTSPSCYIYALQSAVSGWNTTSTTSKIELGWMNNNVSIDKASPHMKPTISKASYTADGYQLAEVIADEINSSLYQKITVNENENYKWTVHHRGRTGVDTLALIITDAAGSVYDKSYNSQTDHFSQILNWLKNTKGVTAPADGKTATYTVYTTKLTKDPSKGPSFEGEEANWFSYEQENHPVKFEIHLMSTGTNRWGKYTGSYTSDKNKEILFALTSFESSFSNSSGPKPNGGNLIDKMSFVDEGGHNLLENPSFDDVDANAGYKFFPAANATDTTPTEGIGWCTTAKARVVEIGNFKTVNVYGITAIAEVFNEPYIRDGEQFAELNADEESSLYQIVSTDPGKMYKWSLSHRGRDAIDTMALIIGPAQPYAPKKKANNKNNRDQLMQISDWLYSQTEVPLELPTDGGCSSKIKLYTPKFNSDGGWTENSNIFSFYKDDTHTEEWSVWVIASKNDKWYDYGELDSTAKYSYECVIPARQKNTIFGFVSHSSLKADGTKNNLSYGNLLDNIAFKEYYYAKVEVAMNDTHGKAQIVVNENNDFIHDEIDGESLKSGWALIGSNFTVHVTEAKDENKRTFVGAYINGQFVPSSSWTKNGETGEYTYTFDNVKSAIKVNIIFAAQQIYYDSRSGYPYQYDPDDSNSGPEVMMAPEERTEYESRAPEEADGWQFVGWKYINPTNNKVTIFEAIHTVTLVGDANSKQTFTVTDGNNSVTGISYEEGITFLGEWKYRQRAIAQTYDDNAKVYLTSAAGGEVDVAVSYGTAETATDYELDNGEKVGKELYTLAYYLSDDTKLDENAYVTVTAEHKTGYTFSGWYDSGGKLISKNTSYTYKVPDQNTVELYAHFDPAGCDLKLNCSTYSNVEGDTQKYFKIYCFFTGLHEGKLYTLSYVSGSTVSNETFTADANGKATVILNMKHSDYAMFIYLPERCKYTIEADDTSSAGFGVKGEVTNKELKRPQGSQETTPVITEHIIFYKASQSTLLKDGKHYAGIADGKDEITITQNSSYTFQVETKYNPSIYDNLTASLCFYDELTGDAKNFIDKTRILMIDLSNSAAPKYYSYTVNNGSNGEVNAIPLTNFTELGSTNKYSARSTDSMITEKLVFVVDYVGTEDLVQSGKISLVYNNSDNPLDNIINPSKKTVNIGEDTPSFTAEAARNGNTSSNGPFAIKLNIAESSLAINTTYREDDFTNSDYAVKLSVVDGSLPDGSYAEIGGNKYFLGNGYIKIPSLTAGDYTVNIYSPVPISANNITFNATLLAAVSASPMIPTKKTVTVQFNCVDVAMDADVVDKVLNPGAVPSFDVTLKHKGVDNVKLTVTKKRDGETLISNMGIPVLAENDKVTVTPESEFNSVSGETYIFTFVGYSGDVPVLEDKCCVVGGYVSK